MRIVAGIVGTLLLLAGLIWLVYILRGVFSQAEGFTALGALWGPLAFHAVTTGLGTALLARAVAPQDAIQAQPAEWSTGIRMRVTWIWWKRSIIAIWRRPDRFFGICIIQALAGWRKDTNFAIWHEPVRS